MRPDFLGLRWACFLLLHLEEVIRPMRSLRGRSIRIGTMLLGLTALGSCIAPILTVPPPGATQITFTSAVITDASGAQKTVWTTEGGSLPQADLATYYVRNRALSDGVFATARADGSFTAPQMDGTANDRIQIYYVTPAGDYSESICVLLTEGSSPPACPE
jgi:hypothetical protein